MNRYRIAIIGFGRWGRNYARLVRQLENAELVGICDGSIDRCAEAAEWMPDAKVTTSLDELLESATPDAVVVATPASTHFAVTMRCIAAGCHILVEKPFTTNSDEGELLTVKARDAGIVLLVGHTFVYNDGVRMLKEIVDSGSAGQIYHVHARRTNLGPVRDDVGALWDLAPHDIAIFNLLMGAPPLWVSAVSGGVLRERLDDVGFVTLHYPSGALGHIHVSWADPCKVREVVVVGSRQRLVFDDLAPVERIRVFEKGVEATAAPHAAANRSVPRPLTFRDGDIVSKPVTNEEPLRRQFTHFLACIADGSRPLSGAREGTDLVRVMEAIDRSVARGGAPAAVADVETAPRMRKPTPTTEPDTASSGSRTAAMGAMQ